MSELEYLHENDVANEKSLEVQAGMIEKLFDRVSALEEIMLNASIAKVDDQGRLSTKRKRGSLRANSPTPTPVDPDDPRVKAPGKRPN